MEFFAGCCKLMKRSWVLYNIILDGTNDLVPKLTYGCVLYGIDAIQRLPEFLFAQNASNPISKVIRGFRGEILMLLEKTVGMMINNRTWNGFDEVQQLLKICCL